MESRQDAGVHLGFDQIHLAYQQSWEVHIVSFGPYHRRGAGEALGHGLNVII